MKKSYELDYKQLVITSIKHEMRSISCLKKLDKVRTGAYREC